MSYFDHLDQLERLGLLKDNGYITQQEFDEQKARLLAELSFEGSADQNKCEVDDEGLSQLDDSKLEREIRVALQSASKFSLLKKPTKSEIEEKDLVIENLHNLQIEAGRREMQELNPTEVKDLRELSDRKLLKEIRSLKKELLHLDKATGSPKSNVYLIQEKMRELYYRLFLLLFERETRDLERRPSSSDSDEPEQDEERYSNYLSLCGALIVLGSFLPWATALGEAIQISGVRGDGKYTAAIGVVLMIEAQYFYRTDKTFPRGFFWYPAAALGIGIYNYINLDNLGLGIGWGLYLCIAASFAAVSFSHKRV